MGPITLFDKSFLQSLSVDEAVLFDNFFLTNIPPIFFAEALADLEKAIKARRTPEQEVGFHIELCIINLLGHDIPMVGHPVSVRGKAVKTADQSGIIFDIPPEAEALNRWRRHEFLEVERSFAKHWRKMIGSLNFEGIKEGLHSIGINTEGCRSLEDAKAISESIIDIEGYSLERMKFVFAVLGIPENLFLSVWERWAENFCPSLRKFSPYAAYVLMIDIFYYIALATNIIASEKVKNMLDLSYLYYLLFCMIFVSSDKFHRNCAPLFLRQDQSFVWGQDLKADLQKIDHYYEKLPEEEKEKGLFKIAKWPPHDDSLLITKLWDKFLPKWRLISKEPKISNGKQDSNIIEKVKEFKNARPIKNEDIDFDIQDPDAMLLQKMVHKKRGKWWQLPKDFKGNENS
jgi:hypothetical protein